MYIFKSYGNITNGKRWIYELVKYIDNFLPRIAFNNYHEPFLGGGSVFFYLQPHVPSYLSDLNPSLIETYKQVQTNVSGVIKNLKE